MLFTSYIFLFLFLPTTFAGFFWIARHSHTLAAFWLLAASVSFYGHWNPAYVLLLLGSISFNYATGYQIHQFRWKPKWAGRLLVFAIGANLALLAYYKYANWLSLNIASATGWAIPPLGVILPLGISFFTFTQIAFLVDVRRGIAKEYNFVHYALFVTYFPHLIAGPLLHYKQLMPQFAHQRTYRLVLDNVTVGLTVFIIGLAKKVLLANSFAEYATPIFDTTAAGATPGFMVAWTGALAYTLQLYFDFSGYSDMAIGISRLFGIQLPLNFNSPYKSQNIIEFWRRWHMTLSQFLRDYLYIPLGGNRHGEPRRLVNLMITMLLGGLWHGANWTFVIWGGLHGIFLAINHLWQRMRTHSRLDSSTLQAVIGRVLSTLITFVCVVIAWVFFRAESYGSAMMMISSMIEIKEILSYSSESTFEGIFGQYLIPQDGFGYLGLLFGVGFGIVWLAPNTQTVAAKIGFATDVVKCLLVGASVMIVLLLAAINDTMRMSEFIYFNF